MNAKTSRINTPNILIRIRLLENEIPCLDAAGMRNFETNPLSPFSFPPKGESVVWLILFREYFLVMRLAHPWHHFLLRRGKWPQKQKSCPKNAANE
jgi:hypothetical protein